MIVILSTNINYNKGLMLRGSLTNENRMCFNEFNDKKLIVSICQLNQVYLPLHY